MPIPIVKDLPLPLSVEKLSDIYRLKTSPHITLIDLDSLSQQFSSGDTDPSEYLTADELEKYESYRYPKRRVEWLGGRLAVKQAAINISAVTCPSHFNDWETCADEHGRPYIAPVHPSSDLPRPEVSISHSKSFCVALANLETQCGIDIQHASSTVVRVRNKFCTEKDIEIMRTMKGSHNEEMRLTLMWSAKEALRKAKGGNPLTGFLKMNLAEIIDLEPGCWIFSFWITDKMNRTFFQVLTFFYQDYGCSVAFE